MPYSFKTLMQSVTSTLKKNKNLGKNTNKSADNVSKNLYKPEKYFSMHNMRSDEK